MWRLLGRFLQRKTGRLKRWIVLISPDIFRRRTGSYDDKSIDGTAVSVLLQTAYSESIESKRKSKGLFYEGERTAGLITHKITVHAQKKQKEKTNSRYHSCFIIRYSLGVLGGVKKGWVEKEGEVGGLLADISSRSIPRKQFGPPSRWGPMTASSRSTSRRIFACGNLLGAFPQWRHRRCHCSVTGLLCLEIGTFVLPLDAGCSVRCVCASRSSVPCPWAQLSWSWWMLFAPKLMLFTVCAQLSSKTCFEVAKKKSRSQRTQPNWSFKFVSIVGKVSSLIARDQNEIFWTQSWRERGRRSKRYVSKRKTKKVRVVWNERQSVMMKTTLRSTVLVRPTLVGEKKKENKPAITGIIWPNVLGYVEPTTWFNGTLQMTDRASDV